MRTGAAAAWGVWLATVAWATAATPCLALPDSGTSAGSLAATAQAWIDCGTQAQWDGHYTDAQAAFDRAREIAGRAGDQAHLAKALEGAGDVRQLLGDLTHGEALLRESLRLREELKDQAGIADSLAALGRYYITAGDDLKTREYSERSLKLYGQLGNRLGAAKALNNIGVSWKYHDVLVALDYFQKSMEEFTLLGDERRANVVRNNTAIMYYQLGDLERANELALAASGIWNRIGAGDRAGVAETTLGIDYLELGDYRTALKFLEKALALRRKMGYTFGVAESWNNLSLVYSAQGAYGQAESALEKSIALSRQINNTDLEAEGLGNLGSVQFQAGRPAAAIASLKASLGLAEKWDAKTKIAFASCTLGCVYLSQKKFDEASIYLRRSLETEQKIHDGLEEGKTLVALAELERKRGGLEQSRELALRALHLGEQTGQLEVQWMAFTELGRTEAALGHRDQASTAYDNAIGVLEDLRTRVAGGERDSAVFFADRTEPYQERLALALEAGHPAEAFHYLERSRARALLDTISGRRMPLSKSMTTEERTEERRLRLALNAVSFQIQSTEQPDESTRRRQDQARLNYEAFQTTLYAVHPELRVARAQTPAIDAKEAETLLSSPAAALLEFAVTPERTWLFVITSEGLRCFEVKVSSAALARRIHQFRRQLANRDLRVDQAGAQLFTLLLAPARSALVGKTEWIIAPDGPLWHLPFQALESRPGRFVIEDYSVSYAQSFTALREEMQVTKRRRAPAKTMLAFGNPAGRDPLPESAQQVQAVAAVYRPDGQAYTGADASEERWKREAPRYRILQFATHAVFDDRSPLYSHIALAEPQPGSSEDGLLEAWEIMQLDLSADLSVLSACETARGGVTPGEGLIGLTWALFVAGSPSALVTQWKVDAASTSDVMIEFHRAWRGGASGVSKAKALQRAQLHVLHKAGSHPFDWAGIVLVGDAR
jgi:CHAT domain-containing protein/tetratricopeptide (TPR) repeat protein